MFIDSKFKFFEYIKQPLEINCIYGWQGSLCQIFKGNDLMCFLFHISCSEFCLESYCSFKKWSTIKLFSSFLLLYVANNQSWKNCKCKHWKPIPWWSVLNVFILWNSKKCVVISLFGNTNFFLFLSCCYTFKVCLSTFWLYSY